MSTFNNFMDDAFHEAQKSNSVPIGCVAVADNKIIARSHNESSNRVGHAEMIAISEIQKMGMSHFENISFYITLEPCCMCLAALSLMRVSRIYYALEDEKFGGSSRIFQNQSAFYMPEMFHIPHEGVKNLMQNFFKNLR